MKLIVTVDDLNEARARSRAFIFLWVNWAFHARQSKFEVSRLLDTWNRDFSNLNVLAYCVDVSEQEGKIWDALLQWLNAEPEAKGNLMMGGAGSLLWTRNGTIVASVVYPAHVGYDKLLEITRNAFVPGD